MNRLKTIWDEFAGLFVDDGSFAAAVFVWLCACGLLLPRLGLPPAWSPVIFFGGLAAILAENVVGRATRV